MNESLVNFDVRIRDVRLILLFWFLSSSESFSEHLRRLKKKCLCSFNHFVEVLSKK